MEQTNQTQTENTVVTKPTLSKNDLVQTNEEISHDAQAIITVICLIFVYPIGFLVMWLWTEWPIWLRLLLSIPVILLIIVLFSFPAILQSIVPHSASAPTFGFK